MKIKDLLLEQKEYDLVELGKKYTGGNFTCPRETTSLEGAPQEVDGNFICSNTNIKSLEGCPREVSKNFWCDNTDITSLIGSPQIVGNSFSCVNTKIKSLEGGPEKVGKYFYCAGTKITSLKGLPKSCKKIFLSVYYDGPVLSLCLVKDLEEVHGMVSRKVSDIINRYLNQGKSGLILAQRELIENDLEIYAKL